MDGCSQTPAARQGTTNITWLLDAHNMLSNQVHAHEIERVAAAFSNIATKIRTYSFRHAFDRFLSHLLAPLYGTLHFIVCRLSRLNAVTGVPSCASSMGVLSIVLAVSNSTGVESSLPFCVLPSLLIPSLLPALPRLLSVSICTKICFIGKTVVEAFCLFLPSCFLCLDVKRKAF